MLRYMIEQIDVLWNGECISGKSEPIIEEDYKIESLKIINVLWENVTELTKKYGDRLPFYIHNTSSKSAIKLKHVNFIQKLFHPKLKDQTNIQPKADLDIMLRITYKPCLYSVSDIIHYKKDVDLASEMLKQMEIIK